MLNFSELVKKAMFSQQLTEAVVFAKSFMKTFRERVLWKKNMVKDIKYRDNVFWLELQISKG